jgi:hypothetical protein
LPFPLPVFNQMSAWAYLWISLAGRKNKTWNQDDPQSSNQSFINFPIWSVITKIPTLKWNVQCSVIPIILGYQMNSIGHMLSHRSNKPYKCYTHIAIS